MSVPHRAKGSRKNDADAIEKKPRKKYPVRAEVREPSCPVVEKAREHGGKKYPLVHAHHGLDNFELDKDVLSVAPYRPSVRKLQHDFKKDLEEVKRLLLEHVEGKSSLDYVLGYIDHALTEV